ncbi:MAG: histidine kinase [Verrucomicrobiota bacterium]
MPGRTRTFAVVVAGLFVGWVSVLLAAGQSTNIVLTNASAILALPADRAFGNPVAIRGIVTAAQPDTEWSGRFFVQDATAGVFVENISTNQPKPGDLVEITGLSHPGGFAPIITSPSWRKLGTAPLPEAKPVPIEQLMAGIEDSQRVEISGIVRAFRPRGAVVVFEIASGGYRLDVNVPAPIGVDPQTLIGAKVRIRGTAATFYSGKLRHLLTVSLHVPAAADFVIEKTEQGDPFAERVIPLGRLAQYRSEHELGKRVHVKGTVTYQRPGEDLFLQDTTGGMQVKSRLLESVVPGDVVEAVGFPEFERYLPVLQDALFRKAKQPRQTPTTTAVTIPELEGGFRHADLVTIQGKVLDRTERRVRPAGGRKSGLRTILTLQSSNFLFSVEGPTTAVDATGISAPLGSLVEVSGVCLMKIADDGRLQSLQLLLPHATDLRILQTPSWWTPQRLLLGLAGLFTVLVVAVSWSIMVARRNTALSVSIREKEQAQIELQDANDHLEERVRERSEQLKLQISARKEAELQFRAVLSERTRLAQELHDTLEQTLTGIALQMDTAARFAPSDATRANHHLELARNLVTQSQAEVRCSVWDLRSRSPDQTDLAGLLLKISQQLTEDTRIAVEIKAAGRVRPLSEIVEENLLRVSQEALTNIIKHSQATQATITLDYGPKNVVLTVTDNGVGFAAAQQAGPAKVISDCWALPNARTGCAAKSASSANPDKAQRYA